MSTVSLNVYAINATNYTPMKVEGIDLASIRKVMSTWDAYNNWVGTNKPSNYRLINSQIVVAKDDIAYSTDNYYDNRTLEELLPLFAEGPGPQGPQGIQGEQGPQGVQGVQGEQGIQGTAGNSVTILGSYPDYAAFAAGAGSLPGDNVGDAWILLSDGSLYSWNGTAWFDAGDIQGPPGPQGPQGIQGEQGIQGVQGIQGIQGVPGTVGGFGKYGSFYDTTNQVGGSIRAFTFNSNDFADGISIQSGSEITFTALGKYNIAFSAQLIKTGGTATNIWIWLRHQGVDVPDSATVLEMGNNNAYLVAAWNFFVNVNTNPQNFELMWYTPSANVSIGAIADIDTPAGVPAVPSIILTVNQVG